MKLVSIVKFEDTEYKIIWLYSNGNCEIQKNDRTGTIKLVSFSELQAL